MGVGALRCQLMSHQTVQMMSRYSVLCQTISYSTDIAGFFVVFQFFHLPSLATLADLEKAGRHFCNTPWSIVNEERGAEIHVDRYCFR